MGEGSGLARDGAQAETGMGVVAGGLQPAIVKAECFGFAILEIEFAIIGLGERSRGEALRLAGIELAIMIEERAGV